MNAVIEKPSLIYLARDCAEETDGDREAWVRLMRTRIEADAALTEEMWSFVLRELWVNRLHNKTRDTFWKRAESVAAGRDSKPATTTRRTEKFQEYAPTLYDFPLPASGKRLGDATREDLDIAINEWSRLSRGHIRSIKWAGMVKKSMGNAHTVKEGVPLDVLRQLMIDAEKAVPMPGEAA